VDLNDTTQKVSELIKNQTSFKAQMLDDLYGSVTGRTEYMKKMNAPGCSYDQSEGVVGFIKF